jgi:riboflavin synthase
MFTGIIEALGQVTGIEGGDQSVRLRIAAGAIAEDVALGDSVSVNGICLTVTEIAPPDLAFDAVHETMRKTTLGTLGVGDVVNVERSLPVGGRLSGHIVQGHVDGAGRIASIRPIGNSYFLYVDVAPELMRYIVTKGSVAVDGISLTVAEAEDRTFAVSIIPHTWEHTNLQHRRAGDPVNIECDIIGKYVERMLGGYGVEAKSESRRSGGDLSMDLLARSGYVAATETETRPW